MIRSMTGYGRSESFLDESIKVIVEIRSINHRYFELHLNAPRQLFVLEDDIRKMLRPIIKRGRLDCLITIEVNDQSNINIDVNWEMVDRYVKAAQNIQARYQLAGELRVDQLLSFSNVFLNQQNHEIFNDAERILSTVEEAAGQLLIMREKEGERLRKDALDRIQLIMQNLDLIRNRSAKVVELYRERLQMRIADFLANTSYSVDEGRLLNEVAVFADKSNIDEELTRLDSHCHQYLALLDLSEPVGRKLDFLLQEMNREINTIGSKANDLEIAKMVIEIKSEIEKLREQVQNIE